MEKESQNPISLKKNVSNRKSRSSGVWLFAVAIIAIILFVLYLKQNRENIKILENKINPNWTRYLKVTNVYDIVVDPINKDNVWFATGEGVKRYNKGNGYWYTYGVSSGLVSEQVTSIACDSQRIWFGTWAGVSYYDRKSGVWNSIKNSKKIKGSKILDLLREGNFLWISNASSGIVRYNVETKETVSWGKKEGIKNGEIYSLAYANNKIYGGSNKGLLYVFDKKAQKWNAIENPGVSSFVSKIWRVKEYNGQLWMGTSHSGVWQYDIKGNKWHTHCQRAPNPLVLVYGLSVDNKNVWAGTPVGISRYDKQNDVWIRIITSDPLTNKPYVVTTIEDDDEYVWYGTYGYGIGKCLKNKMKLVKYSGGMEHDNIRTIGIDNENLFLGYGFLGGYVDIISKDSLIWKKNADLYDGIPSGNVNVISCFDNTTFVGTYKGFALKQKKENTWFSSKEDLDFDLETKSVLKIGNDFYIGTERGLYKFDFIKKELLLIKNTEEFIINSLADKDSLLYMGTSKNGLVCFNMKNRKLKKHNKIKDIEVHDVSSVVVEDSTVWFSVNGSDVCSFSSGEYNYIPFNSLGNLHKTGEKHTPNINGIYIIDKRIWVATNYGIAVIDPKDGNIYIIDYSKGLINNEVLTVVGDDKYVYIGMFGGLNKVLKSYLNKTIFMR